MSPDLYHKTKHLVDSCSMDWRHVRMIHACLMNERPASVAAIGIHKGYSSLAVIEAIKSGIVKRADFIDPTVTTEIKGMVEGIGAIKLVDICSTTYAGIADCWIIDGEHREIAIKDYENARSKDPAIIIIHDSNPEGPHAKANWGAVKISNQMKEDPDIDLFWEDKKARTDENTIRGIIFGFFKGVSMNTLIALEDIAKAESFI